MTKSIATAAVLLVTSCLAAEEPVFTSGLKVGQRPGPYAFVMATGPQRGQAFCYICDTADKPAAIIFAKTLNEPLGKLAAKLDQAANDGAIKDFRTWLTLLDDGKTPDCERRLVAWGRHHALKSMPLGVFEDEVGPPAYRLNRDAEATVLVFVKQKVVANFALRPGDLNDAKLGEIARSLEQLKSKQQ